MKPIHLLLIFLTLFSGISQADIRELIFDQPEDQVSFDILIFPGIENPKVKSVHIFLEDTPLGSAPSDMPEVSKLPEKMEIYFKNRDPITIDNFYSIEENQYFSTIDAFWLFNKSSIILNTHFDDFNSMSIDIKFQTKDTDLHPTYETLNESGYLQWNGTLKYIFENPISSSIDVIFHDRELNIKLYKYIEIDPNTNGYSFKVKITEDSKPDITHHIAVDGLDKWDAILTSKATKLSVTSLQTDTNGNHWVQSIGFSHDYSSGPFTVQVMKDFSLENILED